MRSDSITVAGSLIRDTRTDGRSTIASANAHHGHGINRCRGREALPGDTGNSSNAEKHHLHTAIKGTTSKQGGRQRPRPESHE